MARCKQLIDAGLYTAARMRLEPIVEQHPAWARAISLLGLSYYKEERFEAAVPLFARALEADPGEIGARPYLGWSLYQLGRLEEAEAAFTSLRELKPDFAPAHYGLGLIHLDRDEIEAARASFDTTIDLSKRHDDPPMEGRARARLGDLHLRLGELETAKAQLERAIELMPDEYEALFTLSRVLQRLGDDEGAARARRQFEEAKARARPGSRPLPG